ncbi:MAG: sigma-70 family RNA polymerase sigma factor [Saprospiraceae bacterium]|nr:sigma-70 family RNA polymerase sigma factor [Saprospiraceae bacterium]
MQAINQVWTDERLEAAICGAQADREAALRHLFGGRKQMDRVKKYVVNHGGTEADGQDVFQDAVVLFERNIRQGKYNRQSALETYFFAIVKWHWLTLRRRIKPEVEFNPSTYDEQEQPVDVKIISDDHREVLNSALTLVGDKCKKILLLTGLSLSNEEIAREMGISSPEMAKKDVFRCRERFRELIRQRPGLEAILQSMLRK